MGISRRQDAKVNGAAVRPQHAGCHDFAFSPLRRRAIPASDPERRLNWIGPSAGLVKVPRFRFGMGSAGEGGSVGDWKTRYRSSACPRRAAGSAVHRIRGSLVLARLPTADITQSRISLPWELRFKAGVEI